MTDRREVPSGRAPGAGEQGGEPAPDVLAVLGVRVPGQRSYPGQDSAEHARRLLRRAVNRDHPGEETLRLLSAARGYGIERLPGPPDQARGGHWCVLYEHAFLLDDGGESRLYELEHDRTPDRRLVCEVYADEAAASRAALRHAPGAGGDS